MKVSNLRVLCVALGSWGLVQNSQNHVIIYVCGLICAGYCGFYGSAAVCESFVCKDVNVS